MCIRDSAIRVTTYKYLLRLKTTREVVGKYHRRPAVAKHLKRMALKGRPDTCLLYTSRCV